MKIILVDRNALHDILFVNTLSRIDQDWNRPKSQADMVVCISGGKHPTIVNTLHPLGLGESPKFVAQKVSFKVIDISTPYNSVSGRPSQGLLWIILSEGEHLIKFQTNQGVGCIRGYSTTNGGHHSILKYSSIKSKETMKCMSMICT